MRWCAGVTAKARAGSGRKSVGATYAQFLEDVILYRGLRDVQNGFYIDVGAYRPEENSVTKLFFL